MELWREEDYEQEQDRTQEGEEPVQLPADRRRHYMTFFTALTMVIAAASCILVLFVIRMQRASAEEVSARNAALEDKLTTIETALGSLDQNVTESDLVAAGTAASYAALGDTVDSLRTNLTDYRDNNDIQNEEIGDHLDSVIAQLDKIKEDMNTAQEESTAQDSAIGTRLDSITQENAEGNTNLTKELQTVHKDIAALIDKAGDDQNDNYKELKGILSATDSSLSSLVSSKFDETGSLISSNISRLKGSVDDVSSNVSGLKGSVDSVSTSLGSMQSSVSDVNTNLAVMQANVTQGFTDLGTNLTTNLTTLGADLGANLTTLGTSLDGVSGDLHGVGDQVSGLSERVSGLDTDLEDLWFKVESLASERAAADTTTKDRFDMLEDKIDRILEQVEPEDPADNKGDKDDGDDGGDTNGGGSDSSGSGSTGSETDESGSTAKDPDSVGTQDGQ